MDRSSLTGKSSFPILAHFPVLAVEFGLVSKSNTIGPRDEIYYDVTKCQIKHKYLFGKYSFFLCISFSLKDFEDYTIILHEMLRSYVHEKEKLSSHNIDRNALRYVKQSLLLSN